MFIRAYIEKIKSGIEIELQLYKGTTRHPNGNPLTTIKEKFPSSLAERFTNSISLVEHFRDYYISSLNNEINLITIPLIKSLVLNLKPDEKFELLTNQYNAPNEFTYQYSNTRVIYIDERLIPDKVHPRNYDNISQYPRFYSDGVNPYISKITTSGSSDFYRADKQILITSENVEKLILDEIFSEEFNAKALYLAISNEKFMGFTSEKLNTLLLHARKYKDTLTIHSFISIFTKNKDFLSICEINNDFMLYIEKYTSNIKKEIEVTEDYDTYNAILTSSLDDFIWRNGWSEFKEIILLRFEKGEGDLLEDHILDTLLLEAIRNYPNTTCLFLIDKIRNCLTKQPERYNNFSMLVETRLFNLFSAYACYDKLLNLENEKNLENQTAIEYANNKMTEVFVAVRWSAKNALKKANKLMDKNEYRAAAAISNKLIEDQNSYFDNQEILELHTKILLENDPDEAWISLCESLPLINSKLLIREWLARHYLSKGKLAQAKWHISAIIEFEPNSKVANELKLLLARESALQAISESGIYIENIDSLTGVEFERLLIKQLKKLGFKVQATPGSGDYGADIILDDEDETRYIIQCKRFGSKVNLKAVQEIVAAMKHYSADYAIVATNNSFLKSAIELAKSNDVELWSGTEVLQVMSGDIGFSVLSSATLSAIRN